MKTKILSADHPHTFPHALDVLRNSGIVAFPTDTVYGLGALAFDVKGVERLYGVKGREHTKAIAVLMSDAAELGQVSAEVTPQVSRLVQKFWPGPLTLVLPRHFRVPDIVSPLPTIGVRVPDHPVALKLLELTGPMAVTSANLSGKENTCTAEEVFEQLAGRVHIIIDGGTTPGGIPSTVLDCTEESFKVLRQGPVQLSGIRAALKK